MTTTVEKNNPKIFPKNEAKVNSKDMIAPQVPPKAKLSSQNELKKVVKLEKIRLLSKFMWEFKIVNSSNQIKS